MTQPVKAMDLARALRTKGLALTTPGPRSPMQQVLTQIPAGGPAMSPQESAAVQPR